MNWNWDDHRWLAEKHIEMVDMDIFAFKKKLQKKC